MMCSPVCSGLHVGMLPCLQGPTSSLINAMWQTTPVQRQFIDPYKIFPFAPWSLRRTGTRWVGKSVSHSCFQFRSYPCWHSSNEYKNCICCNQNNEINDYVTTINVHCVKSFLPLFECSLHHKKSFSPSLCYGKELHKLLANFTFTR